MKILRVYLLFFGLLPIFIYLIYTELLVSQLQEDELQMKK